MVQLFGITCLGEGYIELPGKKFFSLYLYLIV